jgi:hypothetical protein
MKYRLLALALIVIAAGAYIYTTTTGGKFDVGRGPSLLYFREDT